MKLKTISTGSQGNCYILENNNEALIIEAGVKFIEVKKALDFNVRKIVGAIISHNHGDHSKYTNDYLKSGIDVHATFGTFKALNINNITNHRVNTFHKDNNDNWINRKIGNFIIKPFDINHDAAEPVGFLIHHPDCGITLFLTDTAYSDYTFKGLNNIIVECNYSEEIIERKLTDKKEFLKNRIIGSHMSLETLIEFLDMNDLSKVNNIVLIHLSDSNSHAVNFQKTITEKTLKNVIIAENNQEIDFNKTPF
jgi:phosphoribosyl 1,2-cyclic phosphodiesterase